MRKESNTKAFLELVRAGLWEKKARLSQFGNVDFEEVMRLAEEQSVIGLVTAGLEHLDVGSLKGEVVYKPSQKDMLQFIGLALQLEQENAAMNRFIESLIDKMRHNGIYAVLVKGQGIAQCYERPLWRACGDVDLLLSDDNYEKVKEFLHPFASTIEKESIGGKHLGMTIEQWVVELHGHLYCGLSNQIDLVIDDVQWDVFYNNHVRLWENEKTQVFLPSADNDVIFIFTHFLKHFYKGGLGLRQICDWCRLLWCYRSELNICLLESRITKMGLMSEWKAFGALVVDILGMPCDAMPLYDGSIHWKRKVRRILSFILMSGNMGYNRDRSYRNYPFVIRKVYSMGRRVGDMVNHMRIFPLDSIRFLFSIVLNGMRSAAKGVG